MSNRTRDAYDRWGPHYDAEPNPQTVLEEPHVLRLVDPKSGDTILDAACGTGRYTRLFHQAGAHVVGIDFSEKMLQEARRRCPNVQFHNLDLREKLPFQDAAFCKINCAQALKHIPDLSRPISEFSRMLVSGGNLTISVTHPEMNWEDYELSFAPAFILSSEADIFHHRLQDYLAAIDFAGLKLSTLTEVPIDRSIEKYLTRPSFAKVRGRLQIAIFHAAKPTGANKPLEENRW